MGNRLMKNRAASKKRRFFAGLSGESLILSCLGSLSSRLISFFKESIFSYIFTGGEKSDAALKTGALSTAAAEHGIKAKSFRTFKRRFATSVENSAIANIYRSAVQRLIYMPVSTYGTFFATLGIYICLVYFVKLYGFGGENTAELSSLIIGAAIMVLSIPLLLCRKPLAAKLYGSLFIRGMLAGLINLGEYNGEKRRGAVGIALIVGSALGVLTFFCGEKSILLMLLLLVFALLVFFSPELGLISAVAVFPFCGRRLICALITASLASYILKVLRGKRNLRLCSANVFVIILGLCFVFELSGGGENAWFAMSMTALYLLAANLLNTKRLIKKCANVLTVGLGVALAVYVAQVFIAALEGASWRYALITSRSVFTSGRELAYYMLLLLPFIFCKAGGTGAFSRLYGYLFTAAIIVYSVVNGYTVCAVLAAIAATLFLAVRGRRIFRPFAVCFGVPIGALYFAAVPISFGDMGFYDTLSGWLAALKAGSGSFFTGVGMSAQSVSLVLEGDSRSMFLQTFTECGFFGLLLLGLAVCFALQRCYCGLSKVGTENRNLAAAAGAVCAVGLMIGLCTNLWADTDMCFVFWLCLGMSGAAYELRKEERRGLDDEQNEW